MTTITAAPATPTLDKTGLGLTFGRVFLFEWIKLTSIRSTWIVLGAIFAIILGLGIVGPLVAGTPTPGATGAASVSTVLLGSNIAVLVIGALGALIGAREYTSGMIRTTLAAVPKRLPMLWAKSLALVALLVPTVVLATIGAFVFGMAVLAGNGAPTASFTDTGVARALLGTDAYLVGLAVIGLCLGTLLRSVAGSISALLGAVIFLPQIAGLLLPSSWQDVLKFLPSNAASSFTDVVPKDGMLSSGAGMVVFGAWVVAALIAAAVSLRARDA